MIVHSDRKATNMLLTYRGYDLRVRNGLIYIYDPRTGEQVDGDFISAQKAYDTIDSWLTAP